MLTMKGPRPLDPAIVAKSAAVLAVAFSCASGWSEQPTIYQTAAALYAVIFTALTLMAQEKTLVNSSVVP